MENKITFDYDGQSYCLEYTKRTVKIMENNGFVPSKILEAPVTYLPELFAGAFLANHRFIKSDVIEAIFEKFENKAELINALIEMYNEPIKALTADSTEGNSIAWKRA